MKKVLSLFLALLLLAGVGAPCALAADGLSEETLFDPGVTSETGEAGVSWAPESIDDQPYVEPEPEAYNIELFEADDQELGSSEEYASDEPMLFSFAAEMPALFAMPAADGLESATLERCDYTELPIRDQGRLSTCWAFSAITCAEINGLKKGLLSGPSSLDLSEWHLCWFNTAGFTDSLGNAGNDHNTISMLSGGNPYYAVMTLACWMGPAGEAATGTPYSGLLAASDSSAASLDGSLSMQDVMHLENAYWLSMQGEADWAALKSLVRQSGAATLCFRYESAYYNGDTSSYCYDGSSTGTNHEVTVVGWDDDYSYANFAESSGLQPSENGAWLCRNSLGTTYGDGGYFWLSYYDKVLISSKGYAAVYDYGSADNYDNNYQYDGCAIYSRVKTDGYANVFTAAANPDGSERLEAVATYTSDTDVSYTLKVYTDLSDPADPTSGTLALEQSGSFDYAGFHTVPLSKTVELFEGETYSVVFLAGSGSAGSYYAPTCTSDSSWGSVNTGAAGESFVLSGSSWIDWYASKNGSGAQRCSNVRIKAYTTNLDHSVTVRFDAAGGVLDEAETSQAVVWGQTVAKLPTPTRSGYSFDGWYDENGVRCDGERQFADILYTARWLRNWNEPFTDLSSTAWYYGNVRYCYQHSIFNGKTDTLFGVTDNATRGQVVAVLYRMAGEPAVVGTLAFDDVKTSAYYADAVLWAANHNIALGSDDDGNGVYSFRPGDNVTRQEFLVFLYRYANYADRDVLSYENTSLSGFSDAASVNSWALAAEKWSVGCGLQNGSGNKLLPRDPITRVQVAAFLSRFDGYEE